jgi:hypothetical protein
VAGDPDESVFGGIGFSGDKKLEHVEIAISRQDPSRSSHRDTWREIPESWSSGYRGFRSHETLAK